MDNGQPERNREVIQSCWGLDLLDTRSVFVSLWFFLLPYVFLHQTMPLSQLHYLRVTEGEHFIALIILRQSTYRLL